jgi:hypothetical protein
MSQTKEVTMCSPREALTGVTAVESSDKDCGTKSNNKNEKKIKNLKMEKSKNNVPDDRSVKNVLREFSSVIENFVHASGNGNNTAIRKKVETISKASEDIRNMVSKPTGKTSSPKRRNKELLDDCIRHQMAIKEMFKDMTGIAEAEKTLHKFGSALDPVLEFQKDNPDFGERIANMTEQFEDLLKGFSTFSSSVGVTRNIVLALGVGLGTAMFFKNITKTFGYEISDRTEVLLNIALTFLSGAIFTDVPRKTIDLIKRFIGQFSDVKPQMELPFAEMLTDFINEVLDFPKGLVKIGKIASAVVCIDRAYTTLEKYLYAIFNGLVAIVNYLMELIAGRSPVAYMVGVDEKVSNWAKETCEMMDKIYRKKLPVTMESAELFANLRRRGLEFLNQDFKDKEVNMRVRQLVQQYLHYLEKNAQVYAMPFVDDKSFRPQPIVLNICGAPRIGKTVATLMLAGRLTTKLCPKDDVSFAIDNPGQFVFYYSLKDDYSSGYRNEPLFVADDADQVKDVLGSTNSFMYSVIAYANNMPTQLNMAGVEQKGNVYFTSKVILMTSNQTTIKTASINSPEAYGQRLTAFLMYPILEVSFADNPLNDIADITNVGSLHNRRIDKDKLKLRKSDTVIQRDVWRFQRVTYDHSGDTLYPKVDGQELTFDEVYSIVSAEYDKRSFDYIKIAQEMKTDRAKWAPTDGDAIKPQMEAPDDFVTLDETKMDFATFCSLGAKEWSYDLDKYDDDEQVFCETFRKQYETLSGHLVIDRTLPSHEIMRLFNRFGPQPTEDLGVKFGTIHEHFKTRLIAMIINDKDIVSVAEEFAIFMYKYHFEEILLAYHGFPMFGEITSPLRRFNEFMRQKIKTIEGFLGKPILTGPYNWLKDYLKHHHLYVQFIAFKRIIQGLVMGFVFFGAVELLCRGVSGAITYGKERKRAADYEKWYKANCNPKPGDYYFEVDLGGDEEDDVEHRIKTLNEGVYKQYDVAGKVSHGKPRSRTTPINIQHQFSLPETDEVHDTRTESLITPLFTRGALYLYRTTLKEDLSMGVAICVDKHKYIMPSHFRFVINGPAKYTHVHMEDILGHGHTITMKTFDESIFHVDTERDLMFCDFSKVPNLQMGKSMFNHFCDEEYMKTKEKFWANFCTLGTAGNVYHIQSSVANAVQEPTVRVEGSVGVPASTYKDVVRYHLQTLEGDCGSPLLLLDKYCNKGRIIGIHVAGASQRAVGYTSLITRQYLQSVLNKVYPQMALARTNLDDEVLKSQYGYLVNSGFRIIGKEIYTNHFAPVSQIIHSKLFGIFDTDKVPSRLGPFVFDGVTYDPLAIAINGYSNVNKQVDQNLLTNCSRSLCNDLFHSEVRKIEPRLLTWKESVVGIPGLDYAEPIPRNTSAGYPYKFTLCKGDPGKYSIFGSDEEYNLDNEKYHSLLVDCLDLEIQAAKGEHLGCIFLDFLKDEKKSRAKVLAGKSRLISSSPLHFTMLCRRYFLTFCSWMMANRTYNGVAVGVNAFSDEWNEVANVFSTNQHYVIAGDYKAFDRSQTRQIMMAILDNVIQPWYSDSHYEERKAIFLTMSESYHMVGNIVYQWPANLPSGCFLTTILNSLYNSVLIRMCMSLIYKDNIPVAVPKSIKHITNQDNWSLKRNLVIRGSTASHVKTPHLGYSYITYGDDNIIGINEPMQFIRPDMIRIYMSHLGMTYTPTDKVTETFQEWNSLTDVTFLKRGFRWDTTVKMMVAPLEMEVIKDMVMWTKRNSQSLAITQSNVETSIIEMALWGDLAYDSHYAYLLKHCRVRMNWTPFAAPWEEVIRRVYQFRPPPTLNVETITEEVEQLLAV